MFSTSWNGQKLIDRAEYKSYFLYLNSQEEYDME